MPAPTAPLAQKTEQKATAMDDEGIIDPTATSIPSNAPTVSAEMHVDEESRPQFPPSAATVTILFMYVLSVGILKASNKKNNDPTPSSYASSKPMGENLYTVSGTP